MLHGGGVPRGRAQGLHDMQHTCRVNQVLQALLTAKQMQHRAGFQHAAMRTTCMIASAH